jgi:glycosyltransferase involved in cell wall biosynthesis
MQLGRGYGQGTERYVTLLAAGMRARGHEALCIAGDPERRGAPLMLDEPVAGDASLRHYPTRSWMAVRGLPADRLRPLLERFRPDIVHVANPAHIGIGLLDAARIARIPVVVTVMDFWWLCPRHTLQHHSGRICSAEVHWTECLRCIAGGHTRGWARVLARTPVLGAVALPVLFFGRATLAGVAPGELQRWMRRQQVLAEALRGAAAVIFPSRTARALIAPRITGRPALHDIPYGLEPRWFETPAHPREARRAFTNDRPPVIGYGGALAEHKGVHLIFDAVRRLGWTDLPVRIAGSGDAAYQARLKAAAVGLNVEFLGKLESAAMVGFLRSLDLMIVPSTWPENLPIVVLEAQAVGTPVLASAVDGIAELIPWPAQLFEVGSAAALADRLAEWRAGRTAFQLASVTTAEEMLDRTAAVYASLESAPPAMR